MGTHRKIRCLVKRCFGMLQITEIYLTETVALESLLYKKKICHGRNNPPMKEL